MFIVRGVNGWWLVLVAILAGFFFSRPVNAQDATGPAAAGDGAAKVMVIPVREQIAPPELYILRRGLKTAIDENVDTVILDMNTPGGRIDVTFEMLKALAKFEGLTVTYINDEAVSAGAIISAGTDEIWFSPGSVIGAAAPVMAGGGDLNETMEAKVVSYLRARARAISEGKRYRGEVVSAMIDSGYELKIDDEVIKPEGELLSLTASEAMREYGEPPEPLLGSGIAGSLEELIAALHGSGNVEVVRLETTWSEKVAQYLTAWAPLLMAAGLVLVFIEFKTPGFGVFGIGGGVLLALVFFGHYIAGLSGHEPALFFALGLLLVFVELLFFPGLMFMALAGGLLMLGSLVWSMADLWPDEPLRFSADVFVEPIASVMIGVILAAVTFFLLMRFLPKGGLWGKMVLETSVGGEPGTRPLVRDDNPDPLIGRAGIAATALYPSGQVEIDGRRYEARLAMGSAPPGTPVVVRRRVEFGLEVEVAES